MTRLLAAATALLIAALAPSPATAQAMTGSAGAPIGFDAVALSDGELARQRGGFALPNGIDLTMAVRIQTDVDGVPLLRTVLTVDIAGARAATIAADGTVTTLDPRGGTALATLPGLSVEHIVGQHVGSVILNSGNDRVIDHQLSVDLSLGNVQPMTIGSALFRVQSLGSDAGILHAVGG